MIILDDCCANGCVVKSVLIGGIPNPKSDTPKDCILSYIDGCGANPHPSCSGAACSLGVSNLALGIGFLCSALILSYVFCSISINFVSPVNFSRLSVFINGTN